MVRRGCGSVGCGDGVEGEAAGRLGGEVVGRLGVARLVGGGGWVGAPPLQSLMTSP